jgi:hypothetical protein
MESLLFQKNEHDVAGYKLFSKLEIENGWYTVFLTPKTF